LPPPPVVVDPAYLAWAKVAVAGSTKGVTVTRAPGPGGRTWLKVDGDRKEFCLHTKARPGIRG